MLGPSFERRRVPTLRRLVEGGTLVRLTASPAMPIPPCADGDRTVRQLAVDLGVHHNTIAEAYRILADEGWLALRRHHGAIVPDRSRPSPPPEARTSLLQRLRELTAEAQAAGLAPGVIAESMRSIATQPTAEKPKKA
jgi:DNA-binding transcriptional regulator YhcF (GntR family)